MDASMHRRTPKTFTTTGDRFFEMQKLFKGPKLHIPVPDDTIPALGTYPVHEKNCAIEVWEAKPWSPDHHWGRSRDARKPPKPRDGDHLGPGSYKVKPTVDGSITGKAKGGHVSTQNRDMREKLLLPNAPVALPKDNPGAGTYKIPDDWVKRKVSHQPHWFGRSDRFKEGRANSDSVPPVGTYHQRRAHTAIGGSRSRPSLMSPMKSREGKTLSRSASSSTLDASAARGGGQSQRSRGSSHGGVFKQSTRTDAMKRRDAERRRKDRARRRMMAPTTRTTSDTLHETEHFLSLTKSYLSPTSKKELLQREAFEDPFTSLKPPNPHGPKHTFGATCHEKPLIVDQGIPGPGSYKVPGTHAAEADPDEGVLLLQARRSAPGVAFTKDPKLKMPRATTSDAPMAPQMSSIKRLDEYRPPDTFGKGPKIVVTIPKEGPGPGEYDTAKSTLNIVESPTPSSPGTPGTPVSPTKHSFGKSLRGAMYNVPDTPGATLEQPSSFKIRVNPHGPGHSMGAVGHQDDPLLEGADTMLAQQSTFKIDALSPKLDHSFGSSKRFAVPSQSSTGGPGRYTPMWKQFEPRVPGQPFGGKMEGETSKLHLGPGMGLKGTYGPSFMPGDADVMDTKLHMSFSPSKRTFATEGRGDQGDFPGPGHYGPDISESLFMDPSLRPGANDLARSRTLSQRFKQTT